MIRLYNILFFILISSFVVAQDDVMYLSCCIEEVDSCEEYEIRNDLLTNWEYEVAPNDGVVVTGQFDPEVWIITSSINTTDCDCVGVTLMVTNNNTIQEFIDDAKADFSLTGTYTNLEDLVIGLCEIDVFPLNSQTFNNPLSIDPLDGSNPPLDDFEDDGVFNPNRIVDIIKCK